MDLVALLGSALAWLLLYALLQRLPHPLTRRAAQRLDWLNFAFYLTITLATLYTLWQSPAPLDWLAPATAAQRRVTAWLLGYLLFNSALALWQGADRSILLHHAITLAVYGLGLGWNYLDQVLIWVFLQQLTGVIFHPLMLLRSQGRAPERWILALELLHLLVFFCARLLLMPILTLTLSLRELLLADRYLLWRLLVISAGLTSNLLNGYWFWASLRRTRRLRQRVAPTLD